MLLSCAVTGETRHCRAPVELISHMNSVNDKAPRPVLEPSASRAGGSFIYEPFYGLREKPFSLSADPRFLFRSPAHGPAFDEILAGIRRREGLIVLTGEIGTGKTTLCRSVVQQLDRRTFAAFVADPFVSREDLLKTLLVDFGVISIGDLTRGRFNGASRSDLSYSLYEFLDSLVPLQAFAVLVIDEAQNLSLPLLEEIRILSELERREKLLQVVLVGQPELRSNLKLPEMRQVDQRISVRCELRALDARAVADYVGHRLRIAGRGEGRAEFTKPALEAIYEGSAGVPRLINRICDRALQRAHAARAIQVDSRFVWTAIADLGLAENRVEKRPVHGKPSSPSEPAAVADAPLPSSVPPAPASTTPSEPSPADLTAAHEKREASGLLAHGTAAIEPSGPRHRWAAAAVAAVLAVSGSVGAAGWWYARAQAVEGQLVALLPPARPAQRLPTPVSLPPPGEPLEPQSAPALEAGRAARTVAPGERAGYSILVASFDNRERADRLVEELANAGYGAHAVERNGGAGTGRLTQVRVSGYTSAIDVQRDLQRIRQLPGGYSDARVVERN